MRPNEGLVIAIDGPSASGKSTVSRQVAKALAFIYVDSGSLYRGMTWKAVQSGVDVQDADAEQRRDDDAPIDGQHGAQDAVHRQATRAMPGICSRCCCSRARRPACRGSPC